MNLLIAAHSLATDAVFVIHDHLFTHVPGLGHEDWLK